MMFVHFRVLSGEFLEMQNHGINQNTFFRYGPLNCIGQATTPISPLYRRQSIINALGVAFEDGK